MNQYRSISDPFSVLQVAGAGLHLCLKSTLVFAILIGLSSAFAQLGPTRSESILVFAPHPDDEVIGCAGIIMQALARGARVKVVDITSGDGFDAAAAGLTHKKIDQLGPDDFFALSRLRQTQSRNALEILGGKADGLILLGYPDGDLGNLYHSTDDKVIASNSRRRMRPTPSSRMTITLPCMASRPANRPALFASTIFPVTSYPAGMTVAPESSASGASSVARNVSPGWLFPVSIRSNNRTVMLAPAEIVSGFAEATACGAFSSLTAASCSFQPG